jgi:hypothetical protein
VRYGSGESIDGRVDPAAQTAPTGPEAFDGVGCGFVIIIEVAEIDAFGTGDFAVG